MKIDAPKESALLTTFCKINGESLDATGIYPVMALFRHADDTQTCASLAVAGPNIGQEVMRSIRAIMRDSKSPILECVFGIDRSFKAEQGLIYFGYDFVSIFYWDGQHFRYGVMQYKYSPKGSHIPPVEWANPFWCAQMDKEQNSFSIRANLKRMAELAKEQATA